MQARHIKNVMVYTAIAALLITCLFWLKSLLQICMSGAYAIGALVIFLKVSLKLLPLLSALAAECYFSPRERFSWKRIMRGGKSSVIDIYCFALHNLHQLTGWLNIAFTFGVAYFFDSVITRNIPEEFRLFSIIEKHTHVMLAVFVFILVVSFFAYWEHRIWHTRLFWPIHRFHHSATEFNTLTNTRNHFTEVLLSPLFFTLPVSLLGAPLDFLFFYLAFIQYHGFVCHIDEEVSYGWVGKYLWTDPLYHKLHHSNDPAHMNKNFSGTLPVWDKLFGTFVYEEKPVRIGVTDGEHYARLGYLKIFLKDFLDFLQNIKSFLKRLVSRRQRVAGEIISASRR